MRQNISLFPPPSMMNSFGSSAGYGFTLLWAIHVTSVILVFAGIVLFLILAIKTFTPEQLKVWALWLIVVGTVACLLTIGVRGRPWGLLENYGVQSMNGTQMQMMGRMMEMMTDHDRGADRSERDDHKDLQNMMQNMMRMNGLQDGSDIRMMDGDEQQSEPALP